MTGNAQQIQLLQREYGSFYHWIGLLLFCALIFLSLFVVLLCYACVNAPEGKKVAEVVEQNPLKLKQENIELYQLKQDSLIDFFIVYPLRSFTAFAQSMEDLTLPFKLFKPLPLEKEN